MTSDPTATVRRLHEATVRHDLDALVACFDPAYQSEQPAHPNRAFSGYDQVRTNWAAFFEAVPDFHAEVLRTATVGDTVWSEWVWSGHHRDGSTLDMRGVIILGITDDRIAWARLYMEETELAGADIDETMRHLTRTDEPSTT
jgi:limonene-1,2-epoxide hydrolase